MNPNVAYPSFRNRTAVDELAEYLRLTIQNGVYVVGDRLPPERVLTEELSVARPTLRQAFDCLKAEGYLETKRGATAGTYVTDLVVPTGAWLRRMRADPRELNDIYEYHLMVETTVAGRAARNRSDEHVSEIQLAIDQLRVLAQLHHRGMKPNGSEYAPLRGADTLFHQAIAAASGNRRMAEAVFRARGELFTAALLVMYDDARLGQIREEHEAVLAAIQSADESAARDLMATHITNGFHRLGLLLEEPTPLSAIGSS
jgi:GntR family transcriptional regulator, transcriptional repressor for pyruvate dehydrogenase complex